MFNTAAAAAAIQAASARLLTVHHPKGELHGYIKDQPEAMDS